MTNLFNENTTIEEMQELLQEANENTNGAYENVIKHDFNEFWDLLEMQDLTPSEVANMVHFGTYNPSHEYIGLDGYGNIETMTEDDYAQSILDLQDQIQEDLE